MASQQQWVDWLVRVGVGVDIGLDDDPPCTVRELAEAWNRTPFGVHDDDLDDDDLPAWEVMADVIRDETGMYREGPEVGS